MIILSNLHCRNDLGHKASPLKGFPVLFLDSFVTPNLIFWLMCLSLILRAHLISVGIHSYFPAAANGHLSVRGLAPGHIRSNATK